MNRYIILFRLPLAPGSRVVDALLSSGWQCLTENAFARTARLNHEEVTAHVKSLCRESLDMGLSAFAVIPLRPPVSEIESMLD